MHVFLALIIILSTYILSFKDDFTDEKLTKLVPVVAVIVGIYILLFILGLAGFGG